MNNVTEMINSLVPREVCHLFGVSSMSIESLLTRLNELTDSIQNDEYQIKQLKDEIAYELISNNVILSNIQNKKYQLSVSQNLLKQIQQDIKKLTNQKRSILEGNFEGQITLKMAQTKGFVYLPIDTQHAIEFLASELRFPLISFSKVSKQKNIEKKLEKSESFIDVDGYIESNVNNFQFTTNMKVEINNLFNESIKYCSGLRSIYNDQISLNSNLNEKISLIQNEVKLKHEERNNREIELNQLSFEINRTLHDKKVIKVRPDRFEEREKGKKIISSKKKEFYRLNRILNEFRNNRFLEHQKHKHKKCQNSFNSFDLEVHCFDDNFHFDDDLDNLTRNVRRNVLHLAKDVVSFRNEIKNKFDEKDKFIKENISSIEDIMAEIENSNNNLSEKASNPMPDSVLK